MHIYYIYTYSFACASKMFSPPELETLLTFLNKINTTKE